MRSRVYHAHCPACPNFRVDGLASIQDAREHADRHDEQTHRDRKGRVIRLSHFGWSLRIG